MVGNVVKWWKHKILGGYKQFSVQDYTTDSEELMFNHPRTPSSCSAPPDLLLINEHDKTVTLNSQLLNIVDNTLSPIERHSVCIKNSIRSDTANDSFLNKKHRQQQHNQQLYQCQKHQRLSTDGLNDTNEKCLRIGEPLRDRQDGKQTSEADDLQESRYVRQTTNAGLRPQKPTDKSLEELTCDVSVENGKSMQPMHFSFTFYDLDGHHEKITKDDIVGIVYTIYESIGKSLILPNCGSKTINVRITFSPENKTTSTTAECKQHHNLSIIRTTATDVGRLVRRQNRHRHRHRHRHRPRKLIKSDDDDDSNSDEIESNLTLLKNKANIQQSGLFNKLNSRLAFNKLNANSVFNHNNKSMQDAEDIANANDVTLNASKVSAATSINQTSALHNSKATDTYFQHVSKQRTKLLRKPRKFKNQNDEGSRQRSLSVGNDLYYNGHKSFAKTCNHSDHLAPEYDADGGHYPNGKHLAKGSQTPVNKLNSVECWKSSLNRNELISIIRESMEKNRLCFQMNRKPHASVRPTIPIQETMLEPCLKNQPLQIQQLSLLSRQRSNTVSKIPTLITNYNYCHTPDDQTPKNNSSKQKGGGTHICSIQEPTAYIQSQLCGYQQTNPPITSITSNSCERTGIHNLNGNQKKPNLCGYDSFLHATICSPPPNRTPLAQTKIDVVPPLLNSSKTRNQIKSTTLIETIPYDNKHNNGQEENLISDVGKHNASKHITTMLSTPNKIKIRKDVNGIYDQSPTALKQNSQKYYSYNRILSTTRHNLAALNLVSPSMKKTQYFEKRQRHPSKDYDQLLHAKLSQKLQQTSLAQTRKSLQHSKKFRQSKMEAASIVPETYLKKNYMDPITRKVSYECTNGGGDGADNDKSTETQQEDNQNTDSLKEANTIPSITIKPYSAQAQADLDGGVALGILRNGTGEELNDELIERLDVNIDCMENESKSSNINDRTFAAAIATSNIASTPIHRYVHEHIHHHYHHFDDKSHRC